MRDKPCSGPLERYDDEPMSTDQANSSAREPFQGALDPLIEQVRQDRHILAAVLCGSLVPPARENDSTLIR